MSILCSISSKKLNVWASMFFLMLFSTSIMAEVKSMKYLWQFYVIYSLFLITYFFLALSLWTNSYWLSNWSSCNCSSRMFFDAGLMKILFDDGLIMSCLPIRFIEVSFYYANIWTWLKYGILDEKVQWGRYCLWKLEVNWFVKLNLNFFAYISETYSDNHIPKVM